MAEERQETDLGKAREPRLTKPKINWRYIVVLPLWTYGAFLAGSFLVAGSLWVADWAGMPLRLVNQTVLTTTLSVMTYIFAIAIVIGVPLLIWKKRTNLKLRSALVFLLISFTPYLIRQISESCSRISCITIFPIGLQWLL